MIKTLRKKFIATAMIAVTMLIVLMLGAINVSNIVSVRDDIDRTMRNLADADRGDGSFHDTPNDNFPPDDILTPGGRDDRLMSLPYFIVKTDAEGNVIYTEVSQNLSLTADEAAELAGQALDGGSDDGRLNGYRYRISEDRMKFGKTVVFMDTSIEIHSYLRVVILSVGIGAVCWILMFLLVILLSEKAIHPIAENMEKQKQFITNAGHEIKTPLAIIQSNTDAMVLYQGESKWTSNIKNQVSRLDGLMKNLLLLARADESGMKVNYSDFSLSQAVSEAARDFSELMAEKQISFTGEIDSGITVRADKAQIAQLISILLDNALKYTSCNGKVLLRLSVQNGKACLLIENSVTVLPSALPEKLFDRFYRADEARTQSSGGYGIGLSIAKLIADANGGVISASYENESTVAFKVTFKRV